MSTPSDDIDTAFVRCLKHWRPGTVPMQVLHAPSGSLFEVYGVPGVAHGRSCAFITSVRGCCPCAAAGWSRPWRSGRVCARRRWRWRCILLARPRAWPPVCPRHGGGLPPDASPQSHACSPNLMVRVPVRNGLNGCLAAKSTTSCASAFQRNPTLRPIDSSFFFCSLAVMDTYPRCASVMMPWRHSAAWWAFTCWACHFVAFKRAEDDVQEVRGNDAPLAPTAGVQDVRLPGLRIRRDRSR
jgi:hypothetical protein